MARFLRWLANGEWVMAMTVVNLLCLGAIEHLDLSPLALGIVLTINGWAVRARVWSKSNVDKVALIADEAAVVVVTDD